MELILYIKNLLKRLLGCDIKSITRKNKSFLKIGDRVQFLPSASIDFRMPRKSVSLEIGDDSVVDCNFIFESTAGYIKIGKRTFVNGGTNLISRTRIEIGDDVVIAWGCYIYDHNSHSLNWKDRQEDFVNLTKDLLAKRYFGASKNWDTTVAKPIKICDRVWIGFNVIILKGVTIGEGAVVGAGAVVTRDVLPYTVVAGNPARIVRKCDENNTKKDAF
jgi:acetyltransferase-like isoleucine patch superfamily enzyme